MDSESATLNAAQRSVGDRTARLAAAPIVLDAEGITKTFWIPDQRIDSFKERAVHPLRRQHFRRLDALQGVSFNVRRGEFFGIVGRNGSGKSTLLKILASIYKADHGVVRIAGRLAPFIELGVGFNPDISARENVVLNGVMMGLTPKQAESRIDAVFEFAELEEFKELRLKNYSSGMTVRLAFSVMIEADADIMLIDEVLAVGDAAFQQKCADVFRGMRDRGKTVVLVTHDMGAVETYCDRAMLLRDGEMVHLGAPDEVALHYYRLNFERVTDSEGSTMSIDMHSKVLDARLLDEAGDVTSSLEEGEPLRFEAEVEARADMANPVFVIVCIDADGKHVFGIPQELTGATDEEHRLRVGERVRLKGEIENRLTPGKYFLSCWIRREGAEGELALQALPLAEFMVYGSGHRFGVFTAEGSIAIEVEPDGR
jgi:ABC-type polysaccharide/polyol phosphate transport system ATPase subunit